MLYHLIEEILIYKKRSLLIDEKVIIVDEIMRLIDKFELYKKKNIDVDELMSLSDTDLLIIYLDSHFVNAVKFFSYPNIKNKENSKRF